MSFKEWKYIEASSFCSKVADGTHDSPKRQDIGKPLITSKHIKERSIDFDTAYLISQTDFEKINLRSKVDQWDVLISMIGEYCGYCYVERNENIDYAVKNVGIFKTGSKLKAEWMYYYLNSPVGKGMLASLKSGTSQPYISLGALRGLPILIPNSENEMVRITSVLSSLDDKIELNRQTNQTLEAIAQTLFKEMCLPKGDDLPEGWRVGKLGDICEVNKNTLNKKTDLLEWIDYIEISEVNRGIIGNIIRYELGEEPSRAKRKLKHGDTVLSTVRPDRGSYFLSINPLKTDIASTGFAVFSATKVPFSFLHLFLTDENNLKYYGHVANGGAYPAINPNVIMDMDLIIPAENVLIEFHKIVEPLFLLFHQNQKESQTLITLRDSLLPKLMKGEIKS